MFLAGDEVEQVKGYGDDPSNWRHPTLCDVIEQFPSVATILAEPQGSEFEWDSVSEAYLLSCVAQ
jgi:hypothetical protein